MGSSSGRRPCFRESNDAGLYNSLFSSNGSGSNNNGSVLRSHQHMVMGYGGYGLCSSPSSSSSSSPRSGGRFFYDARFEEPQPHFLDSCFLCKKPIGNNKDIFMYRGDTPFCSEECRQEQIDMDEAKEKNMNLSSSVKALRKKEQKRSGSPTKGQGYSVRTGTIAAA